MSLLTGEPGGGGQSMPGGISASTGGERGEGVEPGSKKQSMLSFIPRAFSHPYLHSLCLCSQEWGRVASGSVDT